MISLLLWSPRSCNLLISFGGNHMKRTPKFLCIYTIYVVDFTKWSGAYSVNKPMLATLLARQYCSALLHVYSLFKVAPHDSTHYLFLRCLLCSSILIPVGFNDLNSANFMTCPRYIIEVLIQKVSLPGFPFHGALDVLRFWMEIFTWKPR